MRGDAGRSKKQALKIEGAQMDHGGHSFERQLLRVVSLDERACAVDRFLMGKRPKGRRGFTAVAQDKRGEHIIQGRFLFLG